MSTTVSQIDKVKDGPWDGGHSPFKIEYGKLMMWFFLLSDAFTFSTLLISYGALRFSSPSWPAPDLVFQSVPLTSLTHGYPLVFVGIMTFILIMSSVTMVLAVEAGHRNSKKEVVWWMIATVIGGFMFLGCQALEWSHLHHEGFWWGSIPDAEHLKEFFKEGTPVNAEYTQQFANLFFTITGFHGFHVFSGVIINIVITLNVLFGTYERRGSYLMVEKVGLYWHFVDLVWVFVFTFFYLI
ncbi:cytochrome c oxidase subunit 3 [Mucilaginibacter myungsuensis]|uniref:Cytochrome c oxidase subunit 3 n=1 Tax=Mucilaginibacter myungsuensis TaxID=649104 RepID=A0A929L5N3_9SPHI|nr:cytochrome c oxidase subunit 3 [Mucilaginibacter myungsuensis]MBE9664440.1 cytochrome c oxidase subunit 3 [Mucilaginibacter myungsuensis]MDN3601415.1 cytochrome c oxidase subunit 3 [Mucilaginibacter myungsuensis]